VSKSDVEPYDDAAKAALIELLGKVRREAASDDQPRNLARLTRIGDEHLSALLEAVQAGNRVLVEELLLGSVREDGTRRNDGIRQTLPLWARSTATLDALRDIVVVDETQNPVTVTVHWEKVPRKLRPAAASLASEWVDMYQPRPTGGRPRKSPMKRPPKLGHLDTGSPPA
jgi:hypothetical protein